ncbi:MAG: ATP-binding cassette domain-containing protein [Rhodospirillaceae bacterium]
MIEITGLTKAFGKVQAVRGLALEARDGEITGLIGPNGAGKSTTFRVVFGLMRPDAGRVLVDGHDVVTERLEAQRRIGALPDVRGLYPRLTAREHIRYFGALHGLGGAALEARIDSLIELLEMDGIADRRARGFSRGQELKVALGRALVHEPSNLILDEPTNGLDVVSTRAVRRLLRAMRDAGHCILLSSHLMSEVGALCDRLVIIDRGRAVATGSPDALRAWIGCDDLEEVFVQALEAHAAGQPGFWEAA